jgi:hypothetical protein
MHTWAKVKLLRKRVVYSLMALSLLLVLSSTVTQPAAAALTLGVDPGMSADYTVVGTSIAYNRTHLYVYSKTAPQITMYVFNTRPDGTPDPSSTTLVGDPHNYNIPYMFQWVVMAGGSVGDSLTTHSAMPVILGTLDMTAAGVTRTVNHSNGTSVGYPYVDIYSDKATGIIVKSYIQHSGGDWVNSTLISTNAWSSTASGLSSSTTTLLMVGAAALVVGLLVGVVIGRHGKRKR